VFNHRLWLSRVPHPRLRERNFLGKVLARFPARVFTKRKRAGGQAVLSPHGPVTMAHVLLVPPGLRACESMALDITECVKLFVEMKVLVKMGVPEEKAVFSCVVLAEGQCPSVYVQA